MARPNRGHSAAAGRVIAASAAIAKTIETIFMTKPSTRAYDSGRLNVLVHEEQVVRVVPALHAGETRVVRTVRGVDALRLVGRQEVDVDAAGRERRGGVEGAARPGHAALIVGRVLPTTVDVHDELDVAVGICRGFRRL